MNANTCPTCENSSDGTRSGCPDCSESALPDLRRIGKPWYLGFFTAGSFLAGYLFFWGTQFITAIT